VAITLPAEAPSWLLAARAQYRLGAFSDCADALEAVLSSGEEQPEAYRLLGLALGQLGEDVRAAAALRATLAHAPTDSVLRACLWSVELDAGVLPEEVAASPVLGELRAARDWLQGQTLALNKRYTQSAQAFGAAAAGFASHSPTETLSERLAACYVGQGIAYLLAGEPEAAQACYSRLPVQARAAGSASPVSRFAGELYALAEAIRELPPAERTEVVAPLAELLAAVRMRVRFLDPEQPPQVALRWDFRP
jgi:tetratricopeptide (TPR) repeat protein